MQLDDELCYCFHVSKRKIVNFIRLRKPRRPSQISECGGAGTGCGWCVPYLKRCFDQAQQPAAAADDAITASEYAQARQDYIAAGKGKPPSGSR
ncbi:MAG: bacterioferritin-associated ferredoxin [Planctomycetaceae bacterium]